jgi:hypothetical protein
MMQYVTIGIYSKSKMDEWKNMFMKGNGLKLSKCKKEHNSPKLLPLMYKLPFMYKFN